MEATRPDSGAGRSEMAAEGESLGARLGRSPLVRRAGLAIGLPIVGLAAGYLISLIVIFPPQDAGAGLTRVPDVVGQTSDAAREALERAGLVYEESAGFHHPAPESTVVAQEPLAGQLARPGSSVGVALSRGPRLASVPNVVGLRSEQAEVVLQRAGYASELVWVDAAADVGQVVDVEPAPGTPLAAPAEVRLMVSAGPATVRVPSLVTRSLAEAEATLERLGLRLGRVRSDSTSLAAPGTVLAQSPPEGARVARGARVAVTVAAELAPGG